MFEGLVDISTKGKPLDLLLHEVQDCMFLEGSLHSIEAVQKPAFILL
jgi:hypothetical protein